MRTTRTTRALRAAMSPASVAVASLFPAATSVFFVQSAYDAFGGAKSLGSSANLAGLNITGSGGTNGTVTNSSGNLALQAWPRLTFGSGVLAGFVIEEARTNLCVRSAEIDNATPWAATGGSPFSVTADQGAGPFGTSTMDLGAPSVGSPWRRQQIAVTASQPYSAGIYAKQAASGSATSFRLTSNDTTAWNSGASAKITLSSTPQRVTISWTHTAQTIAYMLLGAVDVAGANDTSCNGNVLIEAGDFQAGAFLTSHIPTAGASVTRTADQTTWTITVGNTGAWAVEWTPLFPASATKQILLKRGAAELYCQNGSVKATDGTNTITLGTATQGALNRVCVAWNASTLKGSLNGAAVVSGSFTGTWGSGAAVAVGHDGAGASCANATIQRIAHTSTFPGDAQTVLVAQGSL